LGYQFADPFDTYGNNYTLLAGYPWDTLSSAGVATVLNTDFRFHSPGQPSRGLLQCYPRQLDSKESRFVPRVP